MAIAVDSTTYSTSADLTSVSVNHTVTGSNTYLLVGVHLGVSETSLTFSTVPTYNGVAMSLVATKTSAASRAKVEIYGLVAPTTGTNAMTFVMSGAGQNRNGISIRSFTGVDQSTPVGTPVSAEAETETITVDVSSAVNELVADFFYEYNTSAGMTEAVGSGQTERINQLAGNGTSRFGSSDEAGASSVTMSWVTTGGANWGWATIGVPIKPASAVTLEQEGFRWYEDNGSESGSSAVANQDTNITAAAGATKRLRMLVNATGDPATKQFKLQWKKSGGSWADVL